MSQLGRSLRNNQLQAIILIRQEGRCAYCNASLFNRPIQWDHFIPYSYSQISSDDNWVASCPGCNRRKHNHIFSNADQIAEFCVEVITKHGALGEGWPEDTELWQRQLKVRASDSPNKGYSLLPVGFDTENEIG